MVDIDVTKVILALIQLFLHLLVLLVFIPLGLQVFVYKLKWRNLIVKVKLAHQKTFLTNLVLFIHVHCKNNIPQDFSF